MSEKKYYCYCSSNCRYETMTKEQILAAIAQATGVVDIDPDAGFVAKVKETNSGQYVTFWVGTQAQYNAIGEKATNCLYIITDDTSKADFEKAVARAISESEKAVGIANEAKQAAKEAKTRRYDYEEKDGSTALMDVNGKALFYIIEIMNLDARNVRETIVVDTASLISGNKFRFPSSPVITGELYEGRICVFLDVEYSDKWALTRLTGYC